MTTLYLMLGYPGAGKTTTAEIIEEITGAVRLTSDLVRLDMFPEPHFTTTEHSALYKNLDARTEQLLNDGKSVIYDANLNRFVHRQEKYDICKRTGAKPVLVWVQTPRELAKNRATSVGRHHLVPSNEAPDAMFERIASVIESPRPEENPITIDGSNITAEIVSEKLGI